MPVFLLLKLVQARSPSFTVPFNHCWEHLFMGTLPFCLIFQAITLAPTSFSAYPARAASQPTRSPDH